ncbi:hypothetical protein MN202_20170 [Rheinheimera muenzenbergensis]|uniref:Uncharacterized protein n=1 Tax=Rheinheimera muenzenbergensis TaxID=1193628 RepID=A0ABU8CCF3_9GAMM
MKDIALYKTIYLNESTGVHLQQYIIDCKPDDLYRLDLINFDVLQFSKFVDGDLLTLQLTPDLLNSLCEAWIAHRQDQQAQQNETKTDQPEQSATV